MLGKYICKNGTICEILASILCRKKFQIQVVTSPASRRLGGGYDVNTHLGVQ